MNLPDTLLGEGWYWAAWAVWLPLFLRSLVKAPWTTIRESEQLNVWLGMIVLLMLIWSLKAGVKPGLSLHLLGATVFTLSFGPHLAFVGLSLVLFGITLNGEGGFFAYAINALLTVGVGVMLSQMLYRLVLRLLPRHCASLRMGVSGDGIPALFHPAWVFRGVVVRNAGYAFRCLSSRLDRNV